MSSKGDRLRATMLAHELLARPSCYPRAEGYVLDRGKVALEGTGTDLLHNEQVAQTYLGGRAG